MATYTVKKGDTLSAIAKQYGTTYQDIAKANGISDPNKIYAGQTLNIGDTASGGSASSSSSESTQAPAQTQPTAPTWNYTKSDAVTQKEALAEQHNANKPGDFSYSLQAGWDDIMNQILNREKFSYDLNGDALYQQYKDQFTTQGKLASMDVMGQAAAMTGGYGNSYAQSVGQQAYQGYLQQLNDKVPELYQLALDKYNQEGQDLYNQYGLYADKYNQEYGEHRDTVTDWQNERNYLTEDARYAGETEYDQALQNFNIEYGSYRDAVTDDQWKQSFEEGIRQFDESQKSSGSSNGGSNDDPKYKSLDVGSTAYNTILADIEAVETYEDLLAITKRYIALGYDPEEINELTADKAAKLMPKKMDSGKGNTSYGSSVRNGLYGTQTMTY